MLKNYKSSRKKIIPINKSIIFIIFTILMLLFLFAGPAGAYERPEYKDGLASSRWHLASICVPCHYTLAENGKASTISSSCNNCHQYRIKGATAATDRKLEMSKIEDIHRDMVCIRCHVGPKSQTEITAVDFHRVMSKTACLTCHTFENGTYIKPLKNKCSDCHSGSPHVVHGKRLEKMCVACHGEDIGKFINMDSGRYDSKLPLNGTNISISEMPEKSGYMTIGQFIMELIGQFTKILR